MMNRLRDQRLNAMRARAVALRAFERPLRLALLVLVVLLAAGRARAQTTEFTFQGTLDDGGGPASGPYDFEFRLFDAETAGTMLGSLQRLGVTVSDGSYRVRLDFGANFPGAPRFIEVAYKNLPGPFITLSPREPVTSVPYAIRSLSAATADQMTATCVGCVADINISQISGDKISGLIPVASLPAGSTSYIQNTTSQQATSNFNISGDGTAGGTLSGNVVNATTQYNLGGLRILSNPGFGNLFAGQNAGQSNTTGHFNAFFGANAGQANTDGSGNAFFGAQAGAANTGDINAFFGVQAGKANTTGGGNAFFGDGAGEANTTGSSNAFFGAGAGYVNTTGNLNTIIGSGATVGVGNLFNATAIGAGAQVSQSNSLVLGSLFGVNVGIGTTAPKARLHIAANGGNILLGDAGCGFGDVGIGFGSSLSACANFALLGNATHTFINRPSGGTIFFREANGVDQVTIKPGGRVTIAALGPGGSTSLCRNASQEISTCSSSLRYKTTIEPFAGGLEIIGRLRPIRFTWKQGGMRDIGLGAEEVERVEPLLTFRNDQGEVEGVKYNQLSAVFINAFKEQQAQIERQQAQIKQQQQEIATLKQHLQEIDALKRLVCADHRNAEVCK